MTNYKLLTCVAVFIIFGAIASFVQTPKRIEAQNRDTGDKEGKRAAFHVAQTVKNRFDFYGGGE